MVFSLPISVEIHRLKLIMVGVILAGLQHGLYKFTEPGFIAGWVIAINILMDGPFDNP